MFVCENIFCRRNIQNSTHLQNKKHQSISKSLRKIPKYHLIPGAKNLWKYAVSVEFRVEFR